MNVHSVHRSVMFLSGVNILYVTDNKHIKLLCTGSSAVAERPRDASCR